MKNTGGRVAVLPLTGKYCMEKRGVTASELSTVRKKPEYRADFVIWDLMFLQRCKGWCYACVLRDGFLKPYIVTKAQR